MAAIADDVVSLCSRLDQLDSEQCADKCSNCAELESQLQMTLSELSSSQLIIELLYKELNETVTKYEVMSNTSAVNGTHDEFKLPTRCLKPESSHHRNNNTLRSADFSQSVWPLTVSNRYAAYLPETTNYQDGKTAPNLTEATQISTNKYVKKKDYRRIRNLPVIRHTRNIAQQPSPNHHKVQETTNYQEGKTVPNLMKATQLSTNNYVKKDYGRIRNLPAIRHPRNIARQPLPNHHKVQGEPVYDQNPNYIPTIVNGQINSTKKDNEINSTNSKLDYIHNLLKESTVKLLNNKAKYLKCCKHKILLMGDSHMRGCAAKMIASLDARFDVCGVVKPGSVTGSLMETAKGEVETLTKNDFLIICSGTNDIDRNDSRNAFRNITNFIKNVNHTNIILISAPCRHDIMDDSHVNSLIKSFNSKLIKLAKTFSHVSIIEIVNNRLLFTKHGLHLNESGKELLSNQLVLHIFSMLEEVHIKPIILGWYDKNLQVNVSSIAQPSHALTNCQLATEHAPKRNRKLPVTRKDDFLWEI